jgi:hypothetical protein
MDWKIKQLDLEFSLQELADYFNYLSNSWIHLRWDSSMDDAQDAGKHTIDGVYGWGIQSNLKDLTVPCPPYHVHKDGTQEYRDTALMFGFAEKIKQAFPYSRQHSIAVHPPGTVINLHIDTPKWIKIHIPITGNNNSYFTFEDEQFVFEPGNAYLVNTSILHGTNNLGDTNRAHLFFKVPADMIDTVLAVKKL